MSIIGIPGAYALITCGGTKARVDAVRSMANDAEGDVGVEIARQADRPGDLIAMQTRQDEQRSR